MSTLLIAAGGKAAPTTVDRLSSRARPCQANAFRSIVRSVILASVLVLSLRTAVSAQITWQQRTEMSDRMMRDIVKSGERLEPALQQQRVQLVFQHLLRYTQRHDVHYRVSILRSRDVNAYALPDGRVVVTSELLARLPSADNAPLAFVLSHELTHVEKHHAERKVEQDLAARLLIGILVSRSDQWTRALGSVSHELVASGHSRELEAEADRGGLERMVAAGFDANGSLTTLRVLGSLEGKGLRVFPTHPRAEDRYRNCAAWMQQHGIAIRDPGGLGTGRAEPPARPRPQARPQPQGEVRGGIGTGSGADAKRTNTSSPGKNGDNPRNNRNERRPDDIDRDGMLITLCPAA